MSWFSKSWRDVLVEVVLGSVVSRCWGSRATYLPSIILWKSEAGLCMNCRASWLLTSQVNWVQVGPRAWQFLLTFQSYIKGIIFGPHRISRNWKSIRTKTWFSSIWSWAWQCDSIFLLKNIIYVYTLHVVTTYSEAICAMMVKSMSISIEVCGTVNLRRALTTKRSETLLACIKSSTLISWPLCIKLAI